MNLTIKRTATVLAAGAVAVAATGIAYAYWTTSGSGTGSATVGNTVAGDAIAITQTTAQATALSGFYPGSTAQNVVVNVANPADFSQKVGNITVTVADKVTGAGTCLGTDWLVTDGVDSPAVGILAKNDSAAGGADEKTGVTVATLQLKDTSSNQDACKGVTPTLTFASASGA